ncbi:PhnE/PtxC family ABC transporter permease [Vibrio splendidus]|uniref:PhnE/PtxC family ABC transporter permease n=1 Tax=Vibrio splendidus TaxID=29497 RepID=UPI003D116556
MTQPYPNQAQHHSKLAQQNPKLDQKYPTQWTKPPLISNSWLRWSLIIIVAVYLYLATQSVHVNWARIYEGSERGWQFILAFMNPDFGGRWNNISQGLIESLTMTLTSTVAGVILSIPFGLGAAKNLAPTPVYLFCRAFISIARSLQEIIVAILCVALFGFGTFAGFVTLTFATIGFLAKLFADEIEAIDPALLIIIVIVMLCEYLSTIIRKHVQ